MWQESPWAPVCLRLILHKDFIFTPSLSPSLNAGMHTRCIHVSTVYVCILLQTTNASLSPILTPTLTEDIIALVCVSGCKIVNHTRAGLGPYGLSGRLQKVRIFTGWGSIWKGTRGHEGSCLDDSCHVALLCEHLHLRSGCGNSTSRV
jgi:hypothetical protein